MNKKKGLFISFEGPEASGKSSQILLLQKYLSKNKIPFVTTREPGGTKLAESLRNLILKIKSDINIDEEILMLMAARSHHINNVIKPALNKGDLVISDRFADSTFVYQGYVNKFGIQKAKILHKNILNNFLPHKTFLFNLPTSKIISRLKNRKSKNKYDKLERNFHDQVNKGYELISKSKRFIKIDASKSITSINKKIIKSINLLI
ncbi:dTMP kinase [Alphaproteobacteria bacterium]|nr:dTMP kinase [Alphaproteobacteria bacterium]